jgi:hypothetical protein
LIFFIYISYKQKKKHREKRDNYLGDLETEIVVHVCCEKRWRLKKHRCNLKEEEKKIWKEWWVIESGGALLLLLLILQFTTLQSKKTLLYRSLVSLIVIDAELGKKDYGSIFCNCNQKGSGTTWCHRTRFNWCWKPKTKTLLLFIYF